MGGWGRVKNGSIIVEVGLQGLGRLPVAYSQFQPIIIDGEVVEDATGVVLEQSPMQLHVLLRRHLDQHFGVSIFAHEAVSLLVHLHLYLELHSINKIHSVEHRAFLIGGCMGGLVPGLRQTLPSLLHLLNLPHSLLVDGGLGVLGGFGHHLHSSSNQFLWAALLLEGGNALLNLGELGGELLQHLFLRGRPFGRVPLWSGGGTLQFG